MALTRTHYNILGMTAIVFWSLTVAVGRSLTEQLGTLTTIAAIFILGGLLSLAAMALSSGGVRQLREAPWKYLLFCGMFFLIYMVTFFYSLGLALDRKQVLELGLVNYLWPSLTVIFSLFVLKKKASWVLAPATLIGLSGIFLVLTQKDAVTWQTLMHNLCSNPVAYALALVAAVSWAIYSNLTNLLAGKKNVNAVPLFMLVSGLATLAVRMFVPETTCISAKCVGELLVLCFFTASAYVLWDYALRKGNVIFVAACSYFTPLLSTLVSCFYLGVGTTIQLWLGCALIIAGSLLSWKSVRN